METYFELFPSCTIFFMHYCLFYLKKHNHIILGGVIAASAFLPG